MDKVKTFIDSYYFSVDILRETKLGIGAYIVRNNKTGTLWISTLNFLEDLEQILSKPWLYGENDLGDLSANVRLFADSYIHELNLNDYSYKALYRESLRVS